MSEEKDQKPTDLFIGMSEAISKIVKSPPVDKSDRYLNLHNWRIGDSEILCQLNESRSIPDPILCLDFTGTMWSDHRKVIEEVTSTIIRAFRWKVFWATLLRPRKAHIVCCGYLSWGLFVSSRWLAREVVLRLSER